MNQNNPSILILGSNSDIGISVAHLFAEKGFDVLMAGHRFDKIQEETIDRIKSTKKVDCIFLQFDGLDLESHGLFCDNLPKIPEVVLCLFGYLGNQDVAESKWSEAEKILKVNFLGQVSILSRIAHVLQIRGKGCIIGISSVAGDRGRGSNFFYGSAKAGFSAFLSGIRNKLFSKGIHVVTIKPGFVRTKMIEGLETPKLLTASPNEVAKACWNAFSKKRNVIYVKPIWRLIMQIIQLIPESIFKKMRL
jgi:short-subunit dehydrogenase